MAASWENFGRQIAAGQGAYAAGETAMGKALAEQMAAMNATRKTDAELAEMERTKQFRDPKFANRIAGALAGFTDPQTAEITGYMERGNWGPDMRFGPPATEDMTTAPAPAFATPDALKRFGQVRGAHMMSLAGKGDSNADHLAQAIGRLIGQGREDSALAGQITPEAAQGLNTYRAADAGKLYQFNEAGSGSQQTGVMTPNPVYANFKAAQANTEGATASLKLAQAKTEAADAEKKRAEAEATRDKAKNGGPDVQKEKAKKVEEAKDVLSLLDVADGLIGKSTGSYAGVVADEVARAVGQSTEGAEAAAQLKVLEGALISKMPKMSGPQSDKDVLLYRQMAGQIGDPTIPAPRKRKAMETIRQINERYAGVQAATAPAPAPAAPAAPKMTADDMRASVLKARQAIASGKDKTEVIRRLEAAGITNHGIK